MNAIFTIYRIGGTYTICILYMQYTVYIQYIGTQAATYLSSVLLENVRCIIENEVHMIRFVRSYKTCDKLKEKKICLKQKNCD